MSDKSIVIFKVFLNEHNQKNFLGDFKFKLSNKIIDIRNTILQDCIDKNRIDKSKFNYIDLDNVTDRVYKDFGKLYFDKGILPMTNDNYNLSEFTNENRTFEFVALPYFIKQNNQQNKASGILKKIINEEKMNKNEFSFDTDDFPPLYIKK